MTTFRLLLALTLALSLPSRGLAQARDTITCGARAQIVDHLETRFGESVRSIGLAAPNRIVEVFASDETGSWTITVTTANGRTCMMASGRYFEVFAPLTPGEAL